MTFNPLLFAFTCSLHAAKRHQNSKKNNSADEQEINLKFNINIYSSSNLSAIKLILNDFKEELRL